MGITITVQNWTYILRREKDDRFFLWHHVTPADGGYGVEVEKYLPANYFETHSVKKFYEYVSGLMPKPRPEAVDKHAELKALKQQLCTAGWIG